MSNVLEEYKRKIKSGELAEDPAQGLGVTTLGADTR